MASYGSYKAHLVKKIVELSPDPLDARPLNELSNKTLEKILTDFENGKFYKSIDHDYRWSILYFGKRKWKEEN